MVTTGAVVSGIVYVIVSVFVDALPSASVAVTVIRFSPSFRVIPALLQLDVPDAVPDPPRELDHATFVTPLSSEAVPAIFTLEVSTP